MASHSPHNGDKQGIPAPGSGGADSFESNPDISPPAGPVRPVPVEELPEVDYAPAPARPRDADADAFEQNPRSVVAARAGLEAASRMEDHDRVREAVRCIIEDGMSPAEAGRLWSVSPEVLHDWRKRYLELLEVGQTFDGGTMLDAGTMQKDADLVAIPQIARQKFADNWERLLEEEKASPDVFRQDRRKVFLQTSRLTSWLYDGRGKIDRPILAGVITALVMLLLAGRFLLHRPAGPAEVTRPAEMLVTDNVTVEQAGEIAQQFFTAPDWEARLKLVRTPEVVRPLMEAYYKNHPDQPVEDAALSMGMTSGGITSLSYDVPSLEGSVFLNVLPEDGRLVVDWETSSLYQEVHLTELRARRSVEPQRIAVRAKADEYYNYAFRDAARWECFSLSYPGLPMQFFGYAELDSPAAVTLKSLLSLEGSRALVLSVRFPENAKTDNQVEILEVLSEEWVPGWKPVTAPLVPAVQ